jgi:hypothetical protein
MWGESSWYGSVIGAQTTGITDDFIIPPSFHLLIPQHAIVEAN